MNTHTVLHTDKSHRKTLPKSAYRPMPEEVLEWDIGLQELFCSISIANAWMGIEEADRLAVKQVKESEWFARWRNR